MLVNLKSVSELSAMKTQMEGYWERLRIQSFYINCVFFRQLLAVIFQAFFFRWAGSDKRSTKLLFQSHFAASEGLCKVFFMWFFRDLLRNLIEISYHVLWCTAKKIRKNKPWCIAEKRWNPHNVAYVPTEMMENPTAPCRDPRHYHRWSQWHKSSRLKVAQETRGAAAFHRKDETNGFFVENQIWDLWKKPTLKISDDILESFWGVKSCTNSIPCVTWFDTATTNY